MTVEMRYQRRIEPSSLDWRSCAWGTGVFDMARRPYTKSAEGIIRRPAHVVMVTLRGQAEKVEVISSCGHRYSGADRPGAVSFVPAHCERRMRMRGLAFEWASIALNPTLFDFEDDVNAAGTLEGAAFTNIDDPFIFGMVSEFARMLAADGALDPVYCEAMSLALAHHLVARYGQAPARQSVVAWKLAPWRVRRISDYVDAHFAEPLRVSELADLVGVSPGYLHRAFRATLGKTPLEYINERRVQQALQHLHRDDESLAAVALQVGFVSPSHFTRTFRKITGVNPSACREERSKAGRSKA